VAAPLWACPHCRHRFVTRNLSHSCGRYRVADHFRGKAPAVRSTYRKFVGIVRGCGPVTIYAQKTRIVCMVRVRFASVIAKKNSLQCGLWLRRPVEHPAIFRMDRYGPESFYPLFRFSDPSQIDVAFRDLVREAYGAHLAD
jgi:hypothetical protein